LRVFFSDDVDSMIAELRSQATKSVRAHVLKRHEGDAIILKLHLTAYVNGQLFESVWVNRHSTRGMPPDQLPGLAEEKADEMRQSFIEKKLRGFEVKTGIFQSE